MKRVSIIVLCLLAFANVVMSQSFVELVEKKIEQKDYEGAIELSDAIIKSDYKISIQKPLQLYYANSSWRLPTSFVVMKGGDK